MHSESATHVQVMHNTLTGQLAVSIISSTCMPTILYVLYYIILYYIYGQGSQKLYNWPKILSPPHYRNGVHHTVEIICLYCGELRDVSENI